MSIKNKAKLELVFSAKEWIRSNPFKKDSLGARAVYAIIISLVNFIEDVTGRQFFVKRQTEDDIVLSQKTIEAVSKAKKAGFVKNIYFHDLLPDDPQIIIVSASNEKFAFAGDDFFNTDKAVLNCIGEAVERTCLRAFDKNRIIFDSYSVLKKNALNPRTITSFSENQLNKLKDENLKNCIFDENTKFGWIEGFSLLDSKKTFIPAQIIYLNYPYIENEPMIRPAISTGAAVFTDKSEALYRGVCEVIERDAVMIHYLNRISPPIIDLEKSGSNELVRIGSMFAKKNLELYVLDISTDVPVSVFAALLIDRSGVGPAVTLASAAGLDSKKTIIAAASEVARIWHAVRRKMEKNILDFDSIEARAEKINNMDERNLYWARPKMIKNIEFFICGPRKNFTPSSEPNLSKEKLDKVLSHFKKNEIDVYAVDIATDATKKMNMHAFMTLIPSFQPLYLNETFRLWGGDRLYDAPVQMAYFKERKKENELNPITHPYV